MAAISVLALTVPAAAAAQSPTRSVQRPSERAAQARWQPPRLTGFAATPSGVAWQVNGHDGGQTQGVVLYSAFGGWQHIEDGLVGVEPQHVLEDISLIGTQLYIPQAQADFGVDITTHAALPDEHDCIRSGSGCFAIDQIDPDSHYRYSYTPDATGTTTTYGPVLIDGTSSPDDQVYLEAIDGEGAVLCAFGPRDGQPTADAASLAYLDFSTGEYTALDTTLSAESSAVAMDSSHIVWTHNGHARYLDRDDLSATPAAASPAGFVTDVAVKGDSLAYTTISPEQYSDRYHTSRLHVGAIGGDTFSTVSGRFPNPGDLQSIDGGDFAAVAGTTASDYGAYRVSPDSTRFGANLAHFGFAPAPAVPDDFDNVSRSEPTLVSSAGVWSIGSGARAGIKFGTAGDVPAVTDNRFGIAAIGVFRPSNGTWYTTTSNGAATRQVRWGTTGDIPVAANYLGQHLASPLAVFRPSNGTWHIRTQPTFHFGRAGDVPVPGDYAGRVADDYADQAAVFRPASSTWYVRGARPVAFGRRGDIPAPGDYAGDGRSDIAVYRPSNHTFYLRGQRPVSYGASGDIPVAGDFNGDGITDLAVYRASDHTFYVRGIGLLRFTGVAGRPVGAPPYHA